VLHASLCKRKIFTIIFSLPFDVQKVAPRGILGSMKMLWPQLFKVDLFKSVPEFKIPVYFMEGRHDWEVPAEIAERYFNFITAPSKELIWFEKSAHMPNSEEKDKFNKILTGRILPSLIRFN